MLMQIAAGAYSCGRLFGVSESVITRSFVWRVQSRGFGGSEREGAGVHTGELAATRSPAFWDGYHLVERSVQVECPTTCAIRRSFVPAVPCLRAHRSASKKMRLACLILAPQATTPRWTSLH